MTATKESSRQWLKAIWKSSCQLTNGWWGTGPLVGLGSEHLHVAVSCFLTLCNWVPQMSIHRDPGGRCSTFPDLTSAVTQHGSLLNHRPGQMQEEGGSPRLGRRGRAAIDWCSHLGKCNLTHLSCCRSLYSCFYRTEMGSTRKKTT